MKQLEALGVGTFPSVERTIIEPVELAKFSKESEFMNVTFDLMREVASYVCIAACTLGPGPTWDRDRAVVGGNIVRLYKLLDALLDQTCRRRRETSTILIRLAFETVVNARYLIANFSPALIEKYIRFSLRHERRLHDFIQSNISARSGILEPIEVRMLDSLDRAARIAGISLDSIDTKDRTPFWGESLRKKAGSLNLEGAYDAVFGGMSHNVHGSWQDLYEYHLTDAGNGRFSPNLDWKTPRPQPLTAIGLITVTAIGEFMQFIGGEPALSAVRNQLADLEERLIAVDEAHESFLSNRQSR